MFQQSTQTGETAKVPEILKSKRWPLVVFF